MGKKNKKKKTMNNCIEADVSIHQVANSEKISNTGRLKKQLLHHSFDTPLSLSNEEEEDLDDEAEDNFRSLKPAKIAKNPEILQDNRMVLPHHFSTYPFDFWEVLSNYILPEDIVTFSLICKETYVIVNRPSFWKKLHLDLYRGQSNIPERYRPEGLGNSDKIKLQVVRSLFLLYRPFQERLKRNLRTMGDPHTLKGCLCVSWWHRMKICEGRKEWEYSFLFQRYQKRSGRKFDLPKRTVISWEDVEDEEICLASEKQEFILKIGSLSLAYISPSIMGTKLLEVLLAISVGQSLTMKFGPSHVQNAFRYNTYVITISDIKSMAIVPWYIPHFEH